MLLYKKKQIFEEYKQFYVLVSEANSRPNRKTLWLKIESGEITDIVQTSLSEEDHATVYNEMRKYGNFVSKKNPKDYLLPNQPIYEEFRKLADWARSCQVLIQRIYSRIRIHHRHQSDVLINWLQIHYGVFDPNNDKVRRVNKSPDNLIFKTLCRGINEITRSSKCSIYLLDPTSGKMKLEYTSSDFEPWREKETKITEVFNKLEPKKASGLVYEIIQKDLLYLKSPQIGTKAFTEGYDDYEPKSFHLMSIRYLDRILGVIELKGVYEHQLRGSIQLILQNIVRQLAHYIYRQKYLFANLLKIQSMKYRRKISHQRYIAYNEISNLVANIFLTDVCTIFAIDEDNHDRLFLLGANKRDLFDDLSNKKIEEDIREKQEEDIAKLKSEKEQKKIPPLVPLSLQKSRKKNKNSLAWFIIQYIYNKYEENQFPEFISKDKLFHAELDPGLKESSNFRSSFSDMDQFEPDRKIILGEGFFHPDNIYQKHRNILYEKGLKRKSLFLLFESLNNPAYPKRAGISGALFLHHTDSVGFSENWNYIVRLVRQTLQETFDEYELYRDMQSVNEQVLRHEIRRDVKENLAKLNQIYYRMTQIIKNKKNQTVELMGNDFKSEEDEYNFQMLSDSLYESNEQVQLLDFKLMLSESLTNPNRKLNTIFYNLFETDQAIETKNLESLVRSIIQPLLILFSRKRIHFDFGSFKRENYTNNDFNSRNDFRSSQIKIAKEISVKTNINAFKQIIVNLSDNALKYALAGENKDIYSAAGIDYQNGKLIFYNIGKSFGGEGEKENIFRPNYRGTNVDKRSESDGMGLYTCQQIAVNILKIPPIQYLEKEIAAEGLVKHQFIVNISKITIESSNG